MPTTASLNIVNSYYLSILRFAPSSSLAAVYANELDAGTLTTTQLQNQLLSAAQSSSIPGLLTYDLLYNTTPSTSGVTFLAGYASALQSGNYTISNSGVLSLGTTPGQFNSIQFSLQNVYVNLGASFALAPGNTFAATYGSTDRATFLTQVYTQIFGQGPASSTLSFLLSNFQYYVNYAGSELGGRGAVTGLLLSVAESTGTGAYPAAANTFLSAAANSAATGTDSAKYGSELVANYGSTTSNNVVLTPVVDHVIASAVTGDLTPFLYSGISPTLNVGDTIAGAAGTANNTFTITDEYGAGNDVIPAGVSITNVQNVNLFTQGNAGGGIVGALGGAAGTSSGVFDLTTSTNTTGSTISGVQNTTVLSAGGGTDHVRVDPGSLNPVNVTITHQHVNGLGGVTELGGNNVTVTDGDGQIAAAPGIQGDVVVGAAGVAGGGAGGGFVGGFGGMGAGVTIGSIETTGTGGASLNPTGVIKVTETGDNNVAVYGGTTVTIAAGGAGNITVGDPSNNSITYPTDEPSGAVNITTAGGDQAGTVMVAGTAPTVSGTTTTFNSETVNVNETSLLSNAIMVGQVTASGGVNQAYAPGGAVTVNVAAKIPAAYSFVGARQTGVTPQIGLTQIGVVGGSTVNVTTNDNSVVVGSTVVNGSTAAIGANVPVVGENPTGAVSVVDTAVDYGGDDPSVSIYGGTNVSAQAAGGTVNIGFVNGNTVFAPSGTETVVDTGPVPYDNINDPFNRNVNTIGGTTVSVTTNAGGVNIGQASGMAGTEPTGAITSVDTASAGTANLDATNIFGGTTVTATSANGSITVGDGNKASLPTGNVTTTVAGIETGGVFGSTTTINGINGAGNVVANTTGGGVTAGSTTGSPINGTVTINDTFAGTQNKDAFTVVGGVGSAATPAVSVTTTKSSGAISIGAVAAKLDSTGTVLSNASSFANGNVVVVNAIPANTGIAGATTLYGTGATTVGVVGGSTVSITGGGGAVVTDEQTTVATGGAKAGAAVGASTLATVTLDHAEGASAVTSDALTSLSVLDDVGGNTYTVANRTASGLALTLNNDAAKGAVTVINDGTASSVAITDKGTATAGTVQVNTGATSLSVTNTAGLNLDLSNDGGLTSVNVSNTGNLKLGNLSGSSAAVTVAAGSTGTVSATINAANGSFVSNGTGNNTVTLTSNTVNKSVQAGTGATNTIVANYASGAADTPLTQSVRGFNVLGVGPNGKSAAGTSYDATGFNSLTVGALAGAITFSNVGPGEVLSVTANPGAGNAITLTQNKAAAGNDPTNNAFSVIVGTDGAVGTGTTVGSLANPVVVNTANTSNLAVVAQGTGGLTTDYVQINDPAAKAALLTVSGDESVTLTGAAGTGYAIINANPTTISTAANSKSVIDAQGLTAATSGVSVAGGFGQIKAVGAGVAYTGGVLTSTSDAGDTAGGPVYTQAKDVFSTGGASTSSGIFTLGSGGGYNPFAPVTVTTTAGPTTFYGVFDTGFEQVNLGGSAASVDMINVNDNAIATKGATSGSTGGVNGFTVAPNTTADQLRFTTVGYKVTGDVAAGAVLNLTGKGTLATGGTEANMAAALDPSGNLANNLANVSFSANNGVITVVANGTSQPPSADTTLKLAEIYVAQQAATLGVGQVAEVSDGVGDTYVVSAKAGNSFATTFNATTVPGANAADPGFSVVELVGVSGVTGFGALGNVGATGSVITNAGLVEANGGKGNGSGTANDGGDSLDIVNGAGANYSNLASAAEIDLLAGASGTVTVSQQGGTGNSLFVDALAAVTTNLSTSGDWIIDVKADAAATLGSIADSTGTTTTLRVTGTTALTIGAVSAPVLTTINASLDTGFLTLGSAAAVNNANLKILGATGGDNITANGSGDTITIGSASVALTGAVVLVAAGTGDTVSLVNQAGQSGTLSLDGTGDIVNVDLGTNTIGGGSIAAGVLARSTGGGATINLADGGNDTVYAGSGSTVNLIGNPLLTTAAFNSSAFGKTAGSTATVQVGGDTTGTTSAGFASGGGATVTTITAADVLGSNGNTGTLNLSFVNAATGDLLAGGSQAGAFVNVQGAASLSAALDTAVNQSLTFEQQSGLAGTTLVNGIVELAAKTGLISWFQYAGNTYVVQANNTTGSAAVHTGLQAQDSVVKLAGLVDFTNTGTYKVA